MAVGSRNLPGGLLNYLSVCLELVVVILVLLSNHPRIILSPLIEEFGKTYTSFAFNFQRVCLVLNFASNFNKARLT